MDGPIVKPMTEAQPFGHRERIAPPLIAPVITALTTAGWRERHSADRFYKRTHC